MSKYDKDKHKLNYGTICSINYTDIDEFISKLQAYKNKILEEYPEAFDITIADCDGDLVYSFYRNKNQEELEYTRKIQKYVEQEKYIKYLELKSEFEK